MSAHFFRYSSMLFSANLAASIISMLTFLILARAIGVAELGILTIVLSTIQICCRLFNCQSWQALIKFGVEAVERHEVGTFFGLLKTIFYVEVVSAFCAFACSFLIGYFLTSLLNLSQNVQLLVQLYAFSTFFVMDSIPMGLLRIFGEFKYLSLHQCISALVKLLLVACVPIFSDRILGYIGAFLVCDILRGAMLWTVALTILKRKFISFKRCFHRTSCITFRKQLLKFLILTNLNGSLKLLYRDLDVFILKWFATETAVGFLKLAKQCASGFQKLNESINQVLYPELVSLYSTRKFAQLTALILKVSIPLFILSVFALIIFSVLGEHLLTFLFRPEYAKASRVVFIFLLAESMSMVFGWLPQFLLASGKPNYTLFSLCSAVIVYLVLLFSLVPEYGAVGVAASFLVSIVVVLGTMSISAGRIAVHMSRVTIK